MYDIYFTIFSAILCIFLSIVGQTANYAVVMAQLYTNNKFEGPHPFIVQLRSEETHEPLPGSIHFHQLKGVY